MPKGTLSVILLAIFFLACFQLMVTQVSAQGNKVCEACGMMVSSEAKDRYRVTDESGSIHYVECFMCALRLVSAYNQLHIVTACDWYGPNYTITVESTNFGRQVTVSPSTSMFLNGGSCVINRAAYNQTAADALLASGFSENTLSNQHYALPANTQVTNVQDAALAFGQTSITQPPQTNTPFIVAAAIGVAVIVGSVLAFKKLRKND